MGRSRDSYFGTDVHYLEFHMLKLLRRGGRIGIIVPASPEQIPQPLPECIDVTGLGRSREETADELQQLRADGGRFLGFVRLVARRRQPE